VPREALFWFLATLALNLWLLSRGLARGIELAAKIGMPLLLVFGAVLAVRGLLLAPGDVGVVQSPFEGLNFVWEPQLSGLLDPTTWLAAAGQVFFTLSVGMGSIHCYAAYVKHEQDIALNAAAAGWMNEFVEVILGGTILIPIATAYLGLEVVQAATAGGSGFSLGFLTLPTLFGNWGWFAPMAGGHAGGRLRDQRSDVRRGRTAARGGIGQHLRRERESEGAGGVARPARAGGGGRLRAGGDGAPRRPRNPLGALRW
jgi:SNF family Na+-dependent transporter